MFSGFMSRCAMPRLCAYLTGGRAIPVPWLFLDVNPPGKKKTGCYPDICWLNPIAIFHPINKKMNSSYEILSQLLPPLISVNAHESPILPIFPSQTNSKSKLIGGVNHIGSFIWVVQSLIIWLLIHPSIHMISPCFLKMVWLVWFIHEWTPSIMMLCLIHH